MQHLNLDCGKDPGRISKKDKEIADKLDYSGIDFPVSEKDYPIIENRFNLGVNVFSYDDSYNVYPVYISKNNYNDCMDLLLMHSDEVDEDTYEKKNHYVYIKDFNRFMFNKTKCKNKKYFCKSCFQCFSSEIVLDNHKSTCLSINCEQTVKLSDGSTSFTNYSRQIDVPFKTYAVFECILEKCGEGTERVQRVTSITNSSSTIKYQNHVPCGFSYKLVCVDDRFSKDVVGHRAGVDD